MNTNTPRPIMLWMTSRSRSSLVSKIFVRHGIWWGNTLVQCSGYDTYENQNIKGLISQYKNLYWKKVHLTPVSPKWNDAFTADLMKIVPNDQPWMMKTGVEYFPAFAKLTPYNIFITRNAEDVANSLCSKRRDARYEDALEAAVWRFDYMRQLQEEFGGVFISTDKIIADDFSDVEAAMEYCGIEYNEKAAREAIS